IEENQVEKIRLCNDCPGYLYIDSKANHGYGKTGRVLCLSVPLTGCQGCLNEAYDLYEQAKNSKEFKHIYLQDKSTDTFLGYDCDGRVEWRSDG
ncbi:MAG: histone deacetylase, partial [Firmicutes bacterium]|nr:histone deacetylase [Bacillota bacterium]